MLYQAVDCHLLTTDLPISMLADTSIPISEAAVQTGISGRTIRAWCQQWPGLGHRVGRDWRVDLDLLRDMATCRTGNAGRLTMPPNGRAQVVTIRPRPDSPPPPVRLSVPQPGECLSVAEASAFLGVNRSTIRRWCEFIPAFGSRLLTERGEWLVDPYAALIVGRVRHRHNGRHPPGALVRDQGSHLQRSAARGKYLHALLHEARRDSNDDILKFIASREHVPDCIAQFADNLRRNIARKRTPPAAAAQPGEVRHGTR